MRKTIYVICHSGMSSHDVLEDALLGAGVSALNFPGYQNSAGAQNGRCFSDLMQRHGLDATKPMPDGWGSVMQRDFANLVGLPLQNMLDSDLRFAYVSDSANAYFIDAWRTVCREFGVSVRFLYIRNFPWERPDSDTLNNGWSEFSVATTVLRQQGSDVLCFDKADWQLDGDVAKQAIGRLISGGSVVSTLPVNDVLRSVHLEAHKGAVDELPYELRVLSSVFAGQHFGMPLLLDADNDHLQLLQVISSLDTAIYRLLSRPEHSMRLAPQSWGQSRLAIAASQDDGWATVVFDLQQRLNDSEAKVRELQAVAHDTVKAAAALKAAKAAANNGTAGGGPGGGPRVQPDRPKGGGGGGRKENPKPAQSPAKRTGAPGAGTSSVQLNAVATAKPVTPAGRKWRKFRNNPALFFADAKNPVVRNLGGLIWRR